MVAARLYSLPNFNVWAQPHIESGMASILNATTPIFTVLPAQFLTSDELLTTKKVLGVMIGFIGVYLMMKPELTDGFSWRGLGQAAVLGAGIAYSSAAICGKRFKRITAVVNSAGMLICSGFMMLALVISMDSPWSLWPSLEAMSKSASERVNRR